MTDKREKLVQFMVDDALARGHVPPFRITVCSKAGTLHVVTVAADGVHVDHKVEYDAHDEIERLGLAPDETILEKLEPMQ